MWYNAWLLNTAVQTGGITNQCPPNRRITFQARNFEIPIPPRSVGPQLCKTNPKRIIARRRPLLYLAARFYPRSSPPQPKYAKRTQLPCHAPLAGSPIAQKTQNKPNSPRCHPERRAAERSAAAQSRGTHSITIAKGDSKQTTPHHPKNAKQTQFPPAKLCETNPIPPTQQPIAKSQHPKNAKQTQSTPRRTCGRQKNRNEPNFPRPPHPPGRTVPPKYETHPIPTPVVIPSVGLRSEAQRPKVEGPTQSPSPKAIPHKQTTPHPQKCETNPITGKPD